ncbi:DNA-binding protein [Paraburkholderia youngii]|uniref:DNA-binding protein n=1 Tax=Paraburkholderia youngii TaxID=2782701 RepID=UPI003D2616CE
MKSGNPPNPAFSRHNREMGRTPLNSPETVHAVVRQLLDAAGVAAPVTPLLFRRVVSTRHVRELLGGGDPSWIGRQIRTIEAEVISESSARYKASGLPEPVADSMRGLWMMALEAARLEFAAAQADALASVAAAAAERDNSNALVVMLQTELADRQKEAREQDVRVAQQQAELVQLQRLLAGETDRARRAEAARDQALRASEEAGRQHDEELAAVRERYAGLSKQLFAMTDELRQSRAAAQPLPSRQK